MGSKPVNATQFNAISGSNNPNGGSSNPLGNFGGSINTETTNNSTPTGNFNPTASVPTSGSGSAPLANTTGQANANVGNTQAAVNASMNQQAMNPMMSAPTASGNASAGSTPTGMDGLGSAIGSQLSQTAVGQALKGYLSDAKGAIGGAFSSVGNAISNGINSFGASMFGTGFGGYAGTGDLASETISPALMAADPSLAGAGASAATASAAGDIGAGAATTQSITGAIGSVLPGLQIAGAGYELGSLYAGLQGYTGSKATDAKIGGTLLGGAGAVLGGLFGSNATQAEYNIGHLNATGGVTNIMSAGEKNAGNYAKFGTGVINQFSNLTTAASSALGIKFNPDITITGGISTLHGGATIREDLSGNKKWDNTPVSFDPTNSKSVTNAYFKALTQAAAHSGYTDTQALHNWFYGTAPTTPSGGGINIAPKSSSNSNLAAPGYNQYGNSSIMV